MNKNNFGSFREDGLVYQVKNYETPRPLINYLWNSNFLSAVNHFGGGEGAYGGRAACYIDSQNRGRATLIRNGNRYFYLKDTEHNVVWNPGWYPLRHPLDEYTCEHMPGSTTIRSALNGISVELRVFVPLNEPCEIWSVEIKNESSLSRKLELFSFVEFSLEGYSKYSEYESYVYTRFLKERNMVYAHNTAQERPHEWYDGFVACNVCPDGFETSKKRFLGTYGSRFAPEQIKDSTCSNNNAACEDMVGVLKHTITLEPSKTNKLVFIIGSSDCEETACNTYDRVLANGVDHLYKQAIEHILSKNQFSQIESPELRLNYVFNNWLKRQVAMCTEVGRSTGKGFRDTLQDAMALCTFNPTLAKSKIVETLRHQYSDGRCPRGWLPLDPHIYSDGPTWIAQAVNSYLKETGDFEFLSAQVPYLEGEPATVWDHVLCAARYSSNDIGSHGLVLAHDGDWNDSLNGIGVGGVGESIWTSIAMYYSLGETIEILKKFYPEDSDTEAELERYRAALKKAVQTAGWDGNWFLAGYDDSGNPVGSHLEHEGMIYLNSQTWAVFSGIATKQQEEKCLQAVDQYLESDDGALTLYPPYTNYQPSIGRLTGFVPGIWENGTPYCHGGMFKVAMDFSCGRPNEGWETLMKILPDSPTNPSSHSGCEPYVFTNMYMGPDNPQRGKSSFAWVTGTAGWVLRVIEQYLYGFQPSYDCIRINPSFPDAFNGSKMVKQFRGVEYRITYRKGENKIIFDGVERDSMSIPIEDKDTGHDVVVFC